FGIVFIVASTMATSCSPEIRLGRPLRGRSSRSPFSPSLSYRFRHNSTVGTEVDTFRASAPFGHSFRRTQNDTDPQNNTSRRTAMPTYGQ
ncbi:MAG TPA: hypothetical protein VN517_19370, partial [Terriglobales bacterium]|nr:hypothetical protein [Terriglobales bacterium]